PKMRYGVVLLMLGVLGWGVHKILTGAHWFAPAAVLTPFGYSFILYLTIWSYLLFDHVPDGWTVTGAAFIVTSGLLIWFREMRLRAGRG
ncbi:MAG: EamA/RhaT family transporter, partial [Pseudomonadota bacterium]|nr:EamA/RhaT family transporter [Pseudomonadota bacterium]